ncbi:DUF2062 domain-containing protein [Thiomicrorhabdus aquaedulcis]|uniref:DUF2062 domain-containing protein n=1 Tax=Thiomicrorhabdus aquaedulcis TaxID=2211106 RepID=UPI000FD86CF1|nr:DUF2062 domain-containing protein [Thiomicrorhabdus aquaedulcis]
MIRYLRLKIHQIGRKTKNSVFLNQYFPRFKERVYWAGDRFSFARAGFIGGFCMMLPVPFQMVLGSVFAYFLRANIPLATALAWVTNPLTMWPIWYGGYRFGVWILNTRDLYNANAQITVGSELWFTEVFPHIWQPFFLGNMLLGLIIGSLLYLIIGYFHLFKTLNALWKIRQKPTLPP